MIASMSRARRNGPIGTGEAPPPSVITEHGLKFRANWAKSFVAPALTSRGADALGTTGETSIAGGPTLSVPVSAYPNMVGGIPGCVTGAVTCSVGGGVTGLQDGMIGEQGDQLELSGGDERGANGGAVLHHDAGGEMSFLLVADVR